MIGRVTNVGMIDYTASYNGEKLYLYEQSQLVAEREIKGITGVVFEGNVIYYTMSDSNIIFAESVLGHTLNNYTLKEFKAVKVYKKLNDNEFVISVTDADGEKIVLYNIINEKVSLELPFDRFDDFVYDGEKEFRLSGHLSKDISIYEDDCDYEDIQYSEYKISESGEICEKCHFGVFQVENGDGFVSRPNSSNIIFSLFDNYLEYYFYPRILTSKYIVSKCEQLNGFIGYEKSTGALKFLISISEDLYKDIDIYGFNEQTNVLTIWGGGELHRFKIMLSDNSAIEELHNKYMTAYEADKRGSLRKNFEFNRLFFKAVDSCKVSEIND